MYPARPEVDLTQSGKSCLAARLTCLGVPCNVQALGVPYTAGTTLPEFFLPNEQAIGGSASDTGTRCDASRTPEV